MEDLTGRFMANLVPSSMQAGNTTADDPQLAMTAPGSQSVLPVPDKMDVLPQPTFTNSAPIPVVHPGKQQHAPFAHGNRGNGTFETISIGGTWKEV
jgi:hypothetical protein